jgi:aerobic-type carbon monoxide dehydrogenase small subunit (CoxS/CutS family)
MITLLVNGATHEVDANRDESLLSVLRNRLDLTGTKYGCGEGQCGACTVLLDGRPVRSCLTQVGSVGARRITTVEGVEQDGNLHPVQHGFLEKEAFQCGYCTPGLIMSAVALLNSNPNPSESDIIHSLSGNICRCGTYPRIVTAVKYAASLQKGSR